MKPVSVSMSFFSSLSALTKAMSPGLDLVQSIFSSLSRLTLLMLSVFSSSLFDIMICHNQCKLVSANQRRSFIGVILQQILLKIDDNDSFLVKPKKIILVYSFVFPLPSVAMATAA